MDDPQQPQAYDAQGKPVVVAYDKDGKPITPPPPTQGVHPIRGLIQFLGDIGVLPGHATLGDVENMIDWLPAAGGAFGGLVGAPAGPVGSVTMAGVGGATGEALKQLSNRVIGRPAPTSAGQAAQDIALQGGTQGAAEGAGLAISKPMTLMAERIMQAAVKPGVKLAAKSISRGEDIPIVQTLLKEGINVTPGGVAKLNRIISATNDEIKDAIAGLSGDVSPTSIATRAEAEILPRYTNQANPEADIEAVKNATAEFQRNFAGKLKMPQAQAVKQGTYRALGETAYGTMRTSAIETQKAIARGLKDDIAKEAERSGIDITGMNAREGAAITAKEAVAKRLAAAGNADPVAFAWLAHHPATAAAYIFEKSPAVKSMVARGLYKSAATAAHIPENVFRAILTALAQSEDDQ